MFFPLPSPFVTFFLFCPEALTVATQADFTPNLTQYKAYSPFHQPAATFQSGACLGGSMEDLKFLVLINHWYDRCFSLLVRPSWSVSLWRTCQKPAYTHVRSLVTFFLLLLFWLVPSLSMIWLSLILHSLFCQCKKQTHTHTHTSSLNNNAYGSHGFWEELRTIK